MEVKNTKEQKKLINNRKLVLVFFIVIILFIALLIDMRDQLTYFHDKRYDNYTSISNINIVNWATFLGTIIAVFGTWYVTDQTGKKQMQEARENLLLEKISSLAIHYFVKNMIEDYPKENKTNPLLIIPANSREIKYVEWNREINILNGYFQLKKSSLFIKRPIHFISFDSKVISKILYTGKTIMLLDLKRLESMNFDVSDFFFETLEYLDEEKFMTIDYGTKIILNKISIYYFKVPLDFTKMNYNQFSKNFNAYYICIITNINEFQKNISNLIDVIETDADKEHEIQTYYQAVYKSLEKRNKLYEIIYNTDDKSFYMDDITNHNIKIKDIYIVSSSQEYVNMESDMQLIIKQDEYKEIISELETLNK